VVIRFLPKHTSALTGTASNDKIIINLSELDIQNKGDSFMGVYNEENGFFATDAQLPFTPGLLPPKLERIYMSPVRFFINYRLVPGFAIICAVLLAIIVTLMNIDEEKYSTVAIILFGVIGILCILLLLSVPKTREWELAAELKRYDLTPSATPLPDIWTVNDEGIIMQFSKNGLRLGEKFYWYNHIAPKLATSNQFNRVWLALQFGADPMHAVFVPLSPEAITAVDQFSIPLQNKDALNYLLKNKEKVFGQIYRTGTFSVPEKD
jgi:hypothetical protein